MSADVNAEDAAMVDALDEVWSRIAEMGAGLTEEEWTRPTDVPGWSVQDNMTHLTDLEAMILGRPAPDHTAPEGLAHVKNEPGERNERYVDSRRSWAGADALAEFVEVTHARVAQLRSYSVEDFAADSWTPMGPGTVHDLLPFRVFDSWVHEQDMRRAVDRPGDLDSAAARFSTGMMLDVLSYIVGKKVGAPDGSTVVLTLTGPITTTTAVVMIEGRARPLDTVPDAPTVTVSLASDAYARLACGRTDPDEALVTGVVAIDGDVELGGTVVRELNYMF